MSHRVGSALKETSVRRYFFSLPLSSWNPGNADTEQNSRYGPPKAAMRARETARAAEAFKNAFPGTTSTKAKIRRLCGVVFEKFGCFANAEIAPGVQPHMC